MGSSRIPLHNDCQKAGFAPRLCSEPARFEWKDNPRPCFGH